MRTFIEKLRESRVTNRIIMWTGFGLFLLIVASFFIEPKYEKGVSVGMFAFSNAFAGALAFKFGITMPGVPSDSQHGSCPKCGEKLDVS